MTVRLDHLAIGVRSIDRALELASKGAGARELHRFQVGSWNGMQMGFAAGIKLEALEPIESPEDDFLARFIQHRGEGPHHVTFKVPDIEGRIAALGEFGITPVKVDLTDPNWKECFLHPSLGLGIVVQLAQAGGPWEGDRELPPQPAGSLRCAFLGAEVDGDIDNAHLVFGTVLQGTAVPAPEGVAYTWEGGGTLWIRRAEARPGVRAYVWRVLETGPGVEAPERAGDLYQGPARVLRIPAAETWPG
ncbi:MAG: VOC family protein [Candidatus Dormibacteria bacterium]